jgi:His/Glu/Gln/Arg/opine family amino acid ABC transporter permease subunit
MNETSYSNKSVSRMLEVKKQIGHIPLIRRNEFVYGFLAFLILYGVFVLPANGSISSLGYLLIGGFVVLCCAWVVIIFTDELKWEWIKTLSVFVLIILLGWLYYRYSTAQWGRMQSLFFNAKAIQAAWPTLWMGLGVTVKIAAFSAVLSTALGLLLAVFRSFENKVLNIFVIAYVDFFRAMPILVLMVLIYYALPYLGVRLDAVLSGILALGLNSSAYVSEIFRAGILSVKKGQLEAAHALGLTTMQTLRLVLLPQAIKVVLPPLVGNYVGSAKDTALCSSISIIELLKAGLSEQALLANPSPLIFSTVLYLLLFVPLTRLSSVIEARMKLSQRKVNV